MKDHIFEVKRNVNIPGIGGKTVKKMATVKQAEVVYKGEGEAAEVDANGTLAEVLNLLPGDAEKKMDALVEAINRLVVSDKRSEVVESFGLRQTGDSVVSIVRRTIKMFKSINPAMDEKELAQLVLAMPNVSTKLKAEGIEFSELDPDVQEAKDDEDDEAA